MEFTQIADGEEFGGEEFGGEEFGGEGLLPSSRGMAAYRPFYSIYLDSDQFSCK